MAGDQQQLVAVYWWEGREGVGGNVLSLLPGDTLRVLEDQQQDWYRAISTRTKKVGKPEPKGSSSGYLELEGAYTDTQRTTVRSSVT